MGRVRNIFIALVVIGAINAGCMSNEKFYDQNPRSEVRAGAPAPGKRYETGYYIYRNGKYTFVKGGFRPILSRKAYYRRSMRCITKDEFASMR